MRIRPRVRVAVQTLKALLNTQQTQLAQLRTTYGVQHPKVLELENQIHATQRNLDAELHGVTSANTSELAAAQELEAKMRAAVEEQRKKVLGVNKLQDDGMKFELELESAQSVYKRALDGYDPDHVRVRRTRGDISVVSRAVPPRKRRPNPTSSIADPGRDGRHRRRDPRALALRAAHQPANPVAGTISSGISICRC